MIIGCISDTHEISREVIREIVEEEFKKRKVEVVVHAGDIIPAHVDPELFGGLPVVCVLTKDQAFSPHFAVSPQNWRFVRPAYAQDPPKSAGKFNDPAAAAKISELEEFCELQRIFARLVRIGDLVAYCGHERSFDAFNRPEKVKDFFTQVNQVKDGVYLAITGHSHHQFLYRTNNVTWVNPGAVERSWNSTVEFAVIDTTRNQVIFARLSKAEAKATPVTIGIVSDTAEVSDLDANYWARLAKQFQDRGVTEVICCGYFQPQDIGRPELSDMQVYYYLMPEDKGKNEEHRPANWHPIDHDKPIVEICSHRFYVQHGIGPEQANFSEIQRDNAFKELFHQHQRLDFIVAGLTSDTIYQEAQNYAFIDPGDARDHKCVCTVCLPRRELDFFILPNE